MEFTPKHGRRDFLKGVGAMVSAPVWAHASVAASQAGPSAKGTAAGVPFQISLAEWSLHRTLTGRQGTRLDHLDFARWSKNHFGIEAVEYVNTFFAQGPENSAYLAELKQRAQDHGVKSLLIMVDREGQLGALDRPKRQEAVDRHKRWVEAAKALGCHSIRVNAFSEGTPQAQRDFVADGLTMLTEFASSASINVLVENHGGLSSDGEWLVSVMKLVNHPRCGTLPDFGNWDLKAPWGRAADPSTATPYDRYKGVSLMLPFAKGVSAKSYDFDESGNETSIDYRRMLTLVFQAGYRGHVGIEYEGTRLSEVDGIRATKALLERVRDSLTA